MTKLCYPKQLKQGKTERYGLDISSWTAGDDVSSFNVFLDAGSGVTVSDIYYNNNIISALLTADSTSFGEWCVTFDYSTLLRNDCQCVNMNIIEDCS